MDIISDPQYVINIKDRIAALDLKIHKAGKNKKKLEVAQFQREKQMNQVIENGEPELLRDIQKEKLELTLTEKKVAEQDSAIEKNSEMLQEYQKKQTELITNFKKLETDSKTLGIDANIINKPKGWVDPISTKYAKFVQRKENLIKEINLIKTRHNVTFADSGVERQKKQKKVSELAEKIQKKNEYFQFSIKLIVSGLSTLRNCRN